MGKVNIAIIDIETGGFAKEKNAICEIGVIIVDKEFNELERYEAIIKPYKRIGSDELCSYKFGAMQVNNILMKDIENGKEIGFVLSELIQILKKYNAKSFCGHNSSNFDFKWVDYLIENYSDEPFDFLECLDTMKMAKMLLPSLGSHSLKAVCLHFEVVNNNPHRAIGDAEATLGILKHLIK